jgi:anti-anti-sigma factor
MVEMALSAPIGRRLDRQVWSVRMPIAVEELDGNVAKVVLSGRIDIAGAQAIDMPMSIIAGSRKAVIIDLSGVEFMASMGLRSIVVCAKSIMSKRGKVVLLAPQPQVEEVLTVSGIDGLIPICRNQAEAVAAVMPAPG